jgi:DNA-binding HxlR family transcriptional regulator
MTSEPAGCPAEVTLDFLSGKWRAMIIYWLLQGPMRFNELQRRLGTVTHRTLSKTLKQMEADGLLTRRDYGEIPPRVEYSLTRRESMIRSSAIASWCSGSICPNTST